MNLWTQLLFLHGHISDPQLAAGLSDSKKKIATVRSAEEKISAIPVSTIEKAQQRGLFEQVIAISAAIARQFSTELIGLVKHDNHGQRGNKRKLSDRKLSELIAAYPKSPAAPTRKNAARNAMRALTMFR